MSIEDYIVNPAMRRLQVLHFIGIGGAGMGGIAEVLINEGYKVTGSDIAENAVVQRLVRLGAKINIGHAEANVENASVVVVSSAIDETNVEIKAARANMRNRLHQEKQKWQHLITQINGSTHYCECSARELQR